MQKENLSISIIVPVFNEERNIAPLYEEIKSALSSLDMYYEIIIVDDGSMDKTPANLKEIAAKDSLLKVISFSRNCGQTAALVSGVDHAKGDIIIFMDGDLQNDPKDIHLLIDKIQEGYDVVSGWRKSRKDSFLDRRLPSIIANKLISFLSGVKLHDYGCTLKAYKSSILKDIQLYGEMHRFIPIYAYWSGSKIIEIPVSHRPRIYGKSKYNIFRTLKVVLDLITIKFLASYKTKPIYVFGGTGFVSFALSFICLIILIYNKLFRGISMIQSPLLLLSSLLVIIGIQFILMGLLAEMEIRIYFESLHRPIYHVKEKINL